MENISSICRLLHGSQHDIAAGLRLLLTRWHARAIGIWAFNEERLQLLHFAAVPDMSEEVSRGFQQATRSVDLSQDKLGIVYAVLKQAPVPAYTDPALSPLRDSASWIEKFGCQSSLSIPVLKAGMVSSVLAVSYIDKIQPIDQAWLEQLEIAQMLASVEIPW